MAGLLINFLAGGITDSSGNVLEGGKAYVYEIGTTTKVTPYSDNELTSTLQNPFTLESDGSKEVYVTKDVRVLVEDALGNTVKDIDALGTSNEVVGDTTFGNDSSDTFTLNSGIKGNLLPRLHAVYNIGTAAVRWLNAYFVNLNVSNDVTVGNDVTVTGDVSVTGDLSTSGLNTFGGGVVISGTAGHDLTEEFADEVGVEMSETGANNVIESFTRPTGDDVGVRGYAYSGASGLMKDDSTSFVDVVNNEVDLETTGKPVKLGLIGNAGSGSDPSYVGVDLNATLGGGIELRLLRDGAQIDRVTYTFTSNPDTANHGYRVPPSTYQYTDRNASAGDHTYKLQVRATSSSTDYEVNDVRLEAYEI